MVQERKRRQQEVVHVRLDKEKDFVAITKDSPDYASYQDCLRRVR